MFGKLKLKTDLFEFSMTICQMHDIHVDFPPPIHLTKLRGMQAGFLSSCMTITRIDGIRLSVARPRHSDSETSDSLQIIVPKKVGKNGRKAIKKKFLHDLSDKRLVASKKTCVDQTRVKKGKESKCSRSMADLDEKCKTNGKVREKNVKKKKDLNSRVGCGRFKKSPEWQSMQAKASVSSTIVQLEHDQGLTELKRKQMFEKLKRMKTDLFEFSMTICQMHDIQLASLRYI